MSGFILYSMAELLPVIRRLLPSVPGYSVVEVGSEAGIMTRELAGMASRGELSSLTIIEPFPGELLKELSRQAGVSVFEGMSHDALPVVTLSDVYLIDGDHNYHTVRKETEILITRAEREGKAPLLLYHDVCWPWDRRDLYYAPESIPEEARHPHEYHLGVTLETDELVPNGFRHYGGMAMAKRRGGERNGVRTAIEDVVALHPDWEFHAVPAIFGLGVLFSRKHPEYGRLREEMRVFGDNPVIGMLERNRIELFLRLQKIVDEEDRETTRSFPEPRIGRDAFVLPEGERALWHRLVAAGEAAAALGTGAGKTLRVDIEGVLAHPAPAGGTGFHQMLAHALKAAALLPECVSCADLRRLLESAKARVAGGGVVPNREAVWRELASIVKDCRRATEIEREIRFLRLQPDPEAAGLIAWAAGKGWTVTLRSSSLEPDEARQFAGRIGINGAVRYCTTAGEGEGEDPCFDAFLSTGSGADIPLGGKTVPWRGVSSYAEGSSTSAFHGTAAFPNAEAVERVSAGVRKTVRNINPLLPEEVAAFPPVLSRFASWCADRMEASGIRHAVCFGEDGPFAARLVARVSGLRDVGLSVAALPGTASSFALASLGSAGHEEIARYMEDGGGSAKRLLSMLGICEADLSAPELAELQGDPGRLRLLEMATTGPLASLVESRSAELRKPLADRIGADAIGSGVVAVIGFRWGGLMVNALNRIAAFEGWKCRFAGLFFDGRGERAWELSCFDASFESWLKRIGGDTSLFAPCWKTPKGSGNPIDNRVRLQEGLLDFLEIWQAGNAGIPEGGASDG